MRKLSEYKEHADECRRLAEQSRIPEHKMRLEEMAQVWEMLAKEREKQLRKAQALTSHL
jgi:hypothetical protein